MQDKLFFCFFSTAESTMKIWSVKLMSEIKPPVA